MIDMYRFLHLRSWKSRNPINSWFLRGNKPVHSHFGKLNMKLMKNIHCTQEDNSGIYCWVHTPHSATNNTIGGLKLKIVCGSIAQSKTGSALTRPRSETIQTPCCTVQTMSGNWVSVVVGGTDSKTAVVEVEVVDGTIWWGAVIGILGTGYARYTAGLAEVRNGSWYKLTVRTGLGTYCCSYLKIVYCSVYSCAWSAVFGCSCETYRTSTLAGIASMSVGVAPLSCWTFHQTLPSSWRHIQINSMSMG